MLTHTFHPKTAMDVSPYMEAAAKKELARMIDAGMLEEVCQGVHSQLEECETHKTLCTMLGETQPQASRILG